MKAFFKKTVILLGIISFSFAAKAQGLNDQDVQYLQKLLGAEKRVVMEQMIPDASADFWEVYEKYELAREKVGLKRLDLIKRYEENFDNQKIKDQVVFKATKLSKKNDALIGKYFKKMKRVDGSKNATTFVKVEKYILSSVSAAIMSDLILLEL